MELNIINICCVLLLIVSAFVFSYNPLERREACKGGKEGSKRAAPAQASTKSSTAAARAQSSHGTRKNEGNSSVTTNPSVKTARPASSGGPAYDEQVTCINTRAKTLFKKILILTKNLKRRSLIFFWVNNADH